MNHKNGKWAGQIIELQHEDGSWGFFHTLSNPVPKRPITTEQALRRLYALGFTLDDKPVKKAVKYMNDCLTGKNKIPDRAEKTHNWPIYTELMLSAWIRIFTDKNAAANRAADKWRQIIEASFANGKYDHSRYAAKYEEILKIELNPKAGRLADFVHFYPVSLLTNTLDKKIEPVFFRHILDHESGMYYIYSDKLQTVPQVFKAKKTSNYLRAIELLAKYKNPVCKKQLAFIVRWLNSNRLNKTQWDMGRQAKDGINFPLSDSWKTDEARIEDCTCRISALVRELD